MLTYVGDFETTTENSPEQKSTEVWASALVELFTDKPIVFNSIADTFYFLVAQNRNIRIYYHNLKFDGSFWLDYLFRFQNFKNGFEDGTKKFKDNKHLDNNEIKYLISNFGEWYSITFKINGKIIEIRDSLKLIRMAVEEIGEAFKTEHRKLTMNYYGDRFAGCNITPEEKEYIKNDVLVVKEALEIFYQEKHTKLTIGSCCVDEYKKSLRWDKIDYDETFPNLDYLLPCGITADRFVRHTYRGGYCLVKEGCENHIYKNGATYDNNSLYPSVMLNNKYPTGVPVYKEGEPQFSKNKYIFLHIKAKFFLKDNYLPTLLINNNLRYKRGYYAKNSLPCSDFTRNKIKIGGKTFTDEMELFLTQTDFELMLKHYNFISIKYIDYLEFNTNNGEWLFSGYLDKYKRIKENSTGGKRMVAKLFSNNLGGKFGTSPNATYKVAYLSDLKDRVVFENVVDTKNSVFCPVAAAMTAYGRMVTITAAQKNFKDFLYSDTDSLHLKTRVPIGLEIHDSKYGAWKCESEWDKGFFVRQKTYIEVEEKENGDDHYLVCCAGLPKSCKESLIEDFRSGKKKITDFKKGLKIKGKLMQKRIHGGVILYEDYFTMS